MSDSSYFYMRNIFQCCQYTPKVKYNFPDPYTTRYNILGCRAMNVTLSYRMTNEDVLNGKLKSKTLILVSSPKTTFVFACLQDGKVYICTVLERSP
jgi:hypothetical protein